MKKTLLLFLLPLCSSIARGQQKEAAARLVDEGVAYHDKGDYTGAIKRYDEALELDRNNLLALTEKALTLLSLEQYDSVIRYCQLAIEKHPGQDALKAVYVSYGNACDGLKKTDRSLDVYNEGIRQFPGYYQLYFNKGVTLASVRKFDEALTCFERAVLLNPRHASSHNAIARLQEINQERIPALLAYCRFLILEPRSYRANENLEGLQRIVKGNATLKETDKKGKKTVSLSIPEGILGDTSSDGRNKANNFGTTDLILAMMSGLDYDEKNERETTAARLIRKLDLVFSSLQETQKGNQGFYWDYYVPYVAQMKEQQLVETFVYIALSGSADPEVDQWIKTHEHDINRFYNWSKNFSWHSE